MGVEWVNFVSFISDSFLSNFLITLMQEHHKDIESFESRIVRSRMVRMMSSVETKDITRWEDSFERGDYVMYNWFSNFEIIGFKIGSLFSATQSISAIHSIFCFWILLYGFKLFMWAREGIELCVIFLLPMTKILNS